jgi:hypothetical protein
MKALAWKMNLKIILIVLLADLTTLKGANFTNLKVVPICSYLREKQYILAERKTMAKVKERQF